MREQNGVQILEAGDSFPMPSGLTEDPPSTSRYGYKVVRVNGQPKWEFATEDDYRASEAQRLHIATDAVTGGGCSSEGGGCSGICTRGICVWLIYNGHYYCGCPN